MTTLFSGFGAVAELAHLAIDVAALLVGVQTVRTALDLLDRIIGALRWLAGLLSLLLALVCTAIAEYGPTLGRWLGRAAGTTVRLGRQARRAYDRHVAPALEVAAPAVTAVVEHLDQAGRRFVAGQLGTQYPTLSHWVRTAAIAPCVRRFAHGVRRWVIRVGASIEGTAWA